jgi:hypothetical protein
MKLSELIQNEAKVTELLKGTEWLAEDRSVALAEEAIYELWKIDHAKAIELWEKHVPFAAKGILPEFIVHHAIRDGIDFC